MSKNRERKARAAFRKHAFSLPAFGKLHGKIKIAAAALGYNTFGKLQKAVVAVG